MKKVLIGCAVVAGLVILAGVGGTIYVVRQFKAAIPDTERAEAVEQALLDRDGPLAEYVPPIDGVPAPEQVEAYLEIVRSMRPSFDSAGEALTELMLGMTQESNPLRKVVTGVRGGIGVTREVTHAAVRVDSLLLKTGLSEGDLAYIHALHRYGVMAFERPQLEMSFDEPESGEKARREIAKMLDEIDEQLEDGLRFMLERQRLLIESMEDPRPELAAVRDWLSELIEARSLFGTLTELGLSERQRDAFAAVDLELRELVPRGPGAYFLEQISFGVDRDEDGGNVQFKFGD